MAGYASKVGWTVGRFDWLNNPESKVNRYWRQIEETGQEYTGLILIGLWGDSAGLSTRPNPLRTGDALTRPTPGLDTQKFVPFGETHSEGTALSRARFAFWYYITDGKMGTPSNTQLAAKLGHSPKDSRAVWYWVMTKTVSATQIPFVYARSVKAVAPRNDYKKALASFNPVAFEVALLRQKIGSLMTGAYSTRKARVAIGTDSSGARIRTGPAVQEVRNAATLLRAATGVGVAEVTASGAVQDLIRTGSGTFPAGQWQAMLIDVNREVAAAFQEHLVAQMVSGPHKRPPTDELVRATADPRNRYPSD